MSRPWRRAKSRSCSSTRPVRSMVMAVLYESPSLPARPAPPPAPARSAPPTGRAGRSPQAATSPNPELRTTISLLRISPTRARGQLVTTCRRCQARHPAAYREQLRTSPGSHAWPAASISARTSHVSPDVVREGCLWTPSSPPRVPAQLGLGAPRPAQVASLRGCASEVVALAAGIGVAWGRRRGSLRPSLAPWVWLARPAGGSARRSSARGGSSLQGRSHSRRPARLGALCSALARLSARSPGLPLEGRGTLSGRPMSFVPYRNSTSS